MSFDYDESRSATRFHDSNTINVTTGLMSEGDVQQFFNKLRVTIKKKTGIDTQFVVNTITYNDDTDGKRKPLGVSFIYCSSSEAYHVILGNNPDGTARVETKIDPTWKPKEPEETKEEKKEILSWDDITGNPNSEWGSMVGNVSWASMSEQENPPTIIEKLPPILDSEDFIHVYSNGDKFEVTVQPYFITIYDDESQEIDTNKLFGFVPSNVTHDEIFRRFKIFSHRDGYPKIDIKMRRDSDKNLVFITFNPGTHDARFAREVMKFSKFGPHIVKFEHPKSREPRETQRNTGYRSNSNYNSGSFKPNRRDPNYDEPPSNGGRGRGNTRGRGSGGNQRWRK